VPHAVSSLHPFDAAGRQSAPDVPGIDKADRALYNVGQGSDARVGVKASIERGSLMIEKVEKHEWLQDLAEVGRAHQTRHEAMVLTVSTTYNAAHGGPYNKSFSNRIHTCSNSILNLIAPIEVLAGRGH